MKITKLFHQPHSSSTGLVNNASVSIDTPVYISDRTAYRNTYYLRFKFDEYADDIRIKTGTSKLSGRFDSYSVHLSQNNESFQNQSWVSEEDDTLVKVRLTHPWRLTKVKTYDARGVDILRLDGEALSSEPTVKANANTTIGVEFIGQDFALRKLPVYPYSELTTDSQVQTLVQKGAQADKGYKPMAMTMAPEAGETIESIESMLEEDFAVEDLGVESIPAHGIKWLQLKSYPTGPRITIGAVNQSVDEDTTFTNLWNEPGEHINTPVQLQANSAESIISQIQTSLSRYIEQAKESGESLGSEIFVPITIESDTPAKFKFTQFEINYSLLKKQWDHWNQEELEAGKQTISFTGNGMETHSLALNLPLTAQVEKAVVHVGTDVSESSGFSASSLDTNLNQAKGIQLPQGAKVAKLLDLPQPRQANKVAIAVMLLTDAMNLKVQLLEDVNGKPQGAVLAEADILLEQVFGRQWVFVSLNQSVLLDSKVYWLSLSCMEGDALWLANDGNGKAILETNGRANAITGITLLSQLGLSLPTNELRRPDNLSLQLDTDLAPILGEEVDITSQFSGDLPNSIALLSGESGSVTLYSPEFEYS
ncbi:MAG: hypothetical protein MI867_28470 [Pseudomonadales bacterium]|nr:hypothetical protein [Pseudomonadales bacterium]